ncbi:CoA transferase [Bradyrhizobium sp. NP1]|uniref:CaiB/BaiF CoA transferase family protein n=1 Tax=Bradyrhizobium sp. NP1 TaxID=3049772 RepID=UPI0025A60E5A|nr:CoA transferase [Bradyrhizobium sp. NP1]WJR79022.1 CoA transferase [Bradyrhizobium sp. NP1]
MLADLGADVVKIENPDGGDNMRGWPPLTAGEGGEIYSENFASVNRNKRSVCADLKDAEGIALVRKLAGRCDVLIENFRPGVLARLGLGPDDVRTENPKLIYCSISGYGQEGPYSRKGAFDVAVQGMSGLMSVTGIEGEPPVKCGVPVGDFCAGLYASYAILAAVVKARDTGAGSYIDCSMLGALLGVSALQTSEYFGTGSPGKRLGSAHPRNAPYQAFQASDTHFIVAAGNDVLWREVCLAVGKSDLAEDERFRSQPDRARRQIELAEILQREFRKKTAAEWLDEMDRRGVPCAPINSFQDILSDPHVLTMDLVKPLMLPNGARTRTVGFPLKISDYSFSVYRSPPLLGEHTDEVVAEWLETDSTPIKKTSA